MKKILAFIGCLALSGCLGDSSSDNELIGQVKKVQHITPLLLPDYDRVDVSLGVMRNGVGSMSSQDIWLYIPSSDDYKTLQAAAESGAIIKIKYNIARARFYVPEDYVTHAEITK